MTDTTTTKPIIANGWRIAGWGSALALLLLPAIAMQFSDEAQWTGFDFVVAAIILGVTGIAAEIGVRMSRNWPHLIGYGLATFAGFFTVWSNLAVGIIGAEGEPVNMGFFVLILLGVIAAFAARLKPMGLAHVTGVIAVGQIVQGLVATQAMPGHMIEWGILLMFAALWLVASLCFRRAAKLPGIPAAS